MIWWMWLLNVAVVVGGVVVFVIGTMRLMSAQEKFEHVKELYDTVSEMEMWSERYVDEAEEYYEEATRYYDLAQDRNAKVVKMLMEAADDGE